ncbi:MAG: T9SS type A sorting domain-containing protein [Bacteroidota bacterium]
MRKFSTFLPLLFCCMLFDSFAQIQEKTVFKPASPTQVAVDDGTSIWTGTYRGAVRFSKSTKETTVYDSIVNSGETSVNAMAVTSSSDVWAATNVGVARFRSGAWQSWEFTDKNNYPANTATSICVDSSGSVWIAAGKDKFVPNVPQINYVTRIIAHYNGTEWTSYTLSDLGEDFRIVNMMTAPDGSVWASGSNYASTKGIVLRFKNGIMIKYSSDKDNIPNATLGSQPLTGLTVDKNGNIWVGNSWQVGRFDGNTWTLYKRDNMGPDSLQTGGEIIRSDSKGNIWLAGAFGISTLRNGKWVKYLPVQYKNYTYGPHIKEMIIDAQDMIWCLTDRGIQRFNGTSFESVPHPTGFFFSFKKPLEMKSLALTKAGEVMICGSGSNSNDKGVAVYQNGSWNLFKNNVQPSISYEIMTDRHGNLWGTGWWGVNRYDGKKWDHWGIETGISDSAYGIATDKDNNVWVTTKDGVQRYDGTKWTEYKLTEKKYWREEFPAITVDSSNNIWVSSMASDSVNYSIYNLDTVPVHQIKRTRLYKYNRSTETWQTIESPEGSYFGMTRPLSLVTDPSGTVWFATQPSFFDEKLGLYIHGLYGYTPDNKVTIYNLENHGLDSSWNRTPVSIALDPKGAIWVGYFRLGNLIGGSESPGGIARFNGKEWSDEGNDTSNFRDVNNIFIDPVGTVWTYSHMSYNGKKNQGSKQWVKKDGQWSQSTVFSLVNGAAFDRNGTGWFLTDNQVIVRLRNAYTVGVEEETSLVRNTEISLSPNPANDYINIQTSLPAGNISIRIHSLLGETVAEQFQHNDNEAFSLRLSIENLASGVYFVTLKSGEKSVMRMFMKE